MKRNFSLVLAILFTIFTLPVNGLTVMAAEELNPDDLQDGTYEIDYEVKYGEKNFSNYFTQPATLKIVNNKKYLEIEYTNTDEILDIIRPDDKVVDTISEDKKANTKIVGFDIGSNLSKPVEMGLDMFYPAIHDVELTFSLDSLKVIELAEEEPVVEVKTDIKTEEIKFETVKENDSSLEKGKTKIKQEGKNGSKEIKHKITFTDGVETNRTKSESITKKPVKKIISIGPKEQKPLDKPEKPDEKLDPKSLKDGTYEIDYEVKYGEKDFSNYFTQPATLKIVNNKKYLEIEYTNTDEILDIIRPDDKVVDTISEDKKANTKIVGFDIGSNLSKPVEMGLDMFYPAIHDVELTFSLDSLKVIEFAEEVPRDSVVKVKSKTETEKIKFDTVEKEDASLEKGKTKVKQKGVNGERKVTYEITYTDGKETNRKVENKSITKKPVNKIISIGTKNIKNNKVKDGTYNITAKAMHATDNKASGAAGFINEKAKLSIKDGKIELTIGVPDGPMAIIEGMQVEGLKGKVNKKGNTTYHTFKLKELKNELKSRVQYIVPSMGIDHDVPFRFILEGLDKLPVSVQEIIQGDTEDIDTSDSDNNVVDVTKENTGKSKLTPDKAYKINYIIKHEDGIKDSVANEFFTNKGILLEKDGLTYVQMAIENGDMVRDLKGKYGEAIVVKKIKDGSTVVQLRVDNNLASMLLDMHVIVPEGAIPGFPGYDEDHKALLVFDKDSKQEIKVGDLMLAAIAGNENGPKVSEEESTGTRMGNGTNGNGENGDNGNGAYKPELASNNNKTDEIVAGLKNTDIDKPEFGSNSNSKNTKNDKSKNPQTGDLTNIWLYAFLLAGSLLILGVKFRRRTI